MHTKRLNVQERQLKIAYQRNNRTTDECLWIRAGVARLYKQDIVHREGSAGTVGGAHAIAPTDGGKITENGNELGYGCSLFLSCITTNVSEGN
jgi:hypothetical protein